MNRSDVNRRDVNRRVQVIAVAVLAPLLLLAGAVAAFRYGGEPRPRKLPVAASGPGERAPSALDAATPAVAPDGALRYEAGPAMPALDGKAPAYALSGAIDADVAKKTARAFGLEGDVFDNGGSFTVGSDEAQLNLSPANGGTFDFGANKGTVSTGVASCSAAPPGAESLCAPATTVPSHPAGFPTKDAATAQALAALAAGGVATDGADVETIDDGYAWQVTVRPTIEGLRAQGLESSASVTETGIQYAHGSLGHVERVEEYPLIGTAKAIELLNAGTAYFGGGFGGGGRPMPATITGSEGCPANTCSSAVAAEPVPPPDCTSTVSPDAGESVSCSARPPDGSADSGYGCAAPAGQSCPSVVPVPDSTPQHEQVVTLTDAQLGLILAPSAPTNAYLLPAYVFSTQHGEGPTVLAIDASWLVPTPATTEPPVGSSGSSGPDGSEVPCSTPRSDVAGPCFVTPTEIAPATIEPPSPPTTCGPPVAQADAPQQDGGVGCPIN
ncbi:MAG: hypothetical protein ACR2LQ_11835 [Acidimicrobiales bacterium]